MHLERRVVITGLGALSPLGNSAQLSWAACLKGTSGIQNIDFEIPKLDFGARKADVEEQVETVESPVKVVEADGLTAWLVEDNSLPLVSAQLTFEGAGSASDPAGKEGRAMFAAALMDEGAGEYDLDEVLYFLDLSGRFERSS